MAETGLLRTAQRAQYACTRCKKRKVRCITFELTGPCTICLKGKEQCIFPPRLARSCSKISSADCKTNSSRSLHENSIIDKEIVQKILPTISSNDIAARKLVPGPIPASHEYGGKIATLGNGDCKANTESQPNPSEDKQKLFEPRLFTVLAELVQIFLVSHHPMNPALTQADIESLCNYNTRTPRDQLLLNAVLYVAADFIDPVRLEQSGFHGRSDARRKLAQECMSIFQEHQAIDTIATIQAFLLLSYSDDVLNGSALVHVAREIFCNTALKLNLRHISCEQHQSDLQRHHFIRRLWWLCFTRDQEICWRYNREPIIDSKGMNLPMLNHADFDAFLSLPLESSNPNLAPLFSSDSRLSQVLNTICMQRVKMYHNLSTTLQNYVIDRDTTTTDLPRHRTHHRLVLDRLLRWHKTTKVCLPPSETIFSGDSDDQYIVSVHYAGILLCVLFHLIDVARGIIAGGQDGSASDRGQLVSIVQQAFQQLCQLCHKICANGHIRFMGTDTVLRAVSFLVSSRFDTHREASIFAQGLKTMLKLPCMLANANIVENLLQALLTATLPRTRLCEPEKNPASAGPGNTPAYVVIPTSTDSPRTSTCDENDEESVQTDWTVWTPMDNCTEPVVTQVKSEDLFLLEEFLHL